MRPINAAYGASKKKGFIRPLLPSMMIIAQVCVFLIPAHRTSLAADDAAPSLVVPAGVDRDVALRQALTQALEQAAQLRQSGRLDEARQQLALAMQIAPDSSAVLREADRVKNAELEALNARRRQSLENIKNEREARRQLTEEYLRTADAFYQERKLDQALAQYDLALAESPFDQQARLGRERVVQALESNMSAVSATTATLSVTNAPARSLDHGALVRDQYTWMQMLHKDFLDEGAEPVVVAQDDGRSRQALEQSRETEEEQRARLRRQLETRAEDVRRQERETRVATETQDRNVQRKLRDAQNLESRGQFDEALLLYEEILQVDPANAQARTLMEQARVARIQANAEAFFQEGLKAYQAGNLLGAEEMWKRTLEIYPQHDKAITYLEETQDEVASKRLDLMEDDRRARIERESEDKLNAKVEHLEITQPTPVYDFLNDLKIYANFNFQVISGRERTILGSFNDLRVREVLDAALRPLGLKWTREGNVIMVEDDLQLRYFTLSDDLLQKLIRLQAQNQLQEVVWSDTSGVAPMAGARLELDQRNGRLVVVDSRKNLDRIEDLLRNIDITPSLRFEFKTYKIRPEEGNKLLVLLRQRLTPGDAQSGVLEAERMLSVEGDTLFIKDSPENIRRAEQILMDKDFMQSISSDELEIGTWNLTPRDVLERDSDFLRSYFQQHVEVIEKMLYSRISRSEAEREGRKMWTDADLLKITITDTQDRIERVHQYIESLEIIKHGERSEILFLKHADVNQLSADLRLVLGLETDAGRGGEVWTRTMRTGGRQEEWDGKDFRIRLVRVEPNDPWDDDDDAAEFVISTDVANADPTIESYRTEYITGATGEYEISVIDVRPRGGYSSQGTARIEVRFIPDPALTQLQQAMPQVTEEDIGLSLTPFSDKNALLVRYSNPLQFRELKSWIEQLDIPVAQVSIETRFVTIYEAKFKDFGSEFSIANLGRGGLDFRNMSMDVVFGRDEALQSLWGVPFLAGESIATGLFPATQRLLNEAEAGGFPFYPIADATNDEGISRAVPIASGATPPGTHPLFRGSPVTWQLRMLESEGVISSVTGPKVTVLNGEDAQFTVSLSSMNIVEPNYNLYGDILGGNTSAIQNLTQLGGGTGGAGGLGSLGSLGSLGGGGGQFGGGGGQFGGGGGQFGGGGGGGQYGNLVDFNVSPRQITPTGQVTLDLDIELRDPHPEQPNLQYFVNNLQTVAKLNDGETLILGGWTKDYGREFTSGFPVLRDIPYFGKLFFGQNESRMNNVTMVIFLTADIIR